MDKAIIGKKLGMSQIFTADGKVIPVTVVEAGPCTVVQIKTKENDGYEAVQVGFGAIKETRVNKPVAGHFKKAGVAVKRYLRELRFANCAAYELGQELTCDVFADSRVFKNKHMAGQWGHEKVTVQNLTVARVDKARNLLLIKGAIPGPKGGVVVVKDSVKG